jgi:MSHA biogenesis protein MshL
VSEKQKNINLGSLGSYQLPLEASTVSETDSIVRVPDGQIVAIGGLMTQQQSREVTGVTGLGQLPVVGGLFRQTSTVLRKRELVILMKPSVIHDDSNWPEADASTPQSRLQAFTPAPVSQAPISPAPAAPPAADSTR